MNITPAWEFPANTLADFVSRTGRLPRQSGSDSDVEKRAGNILRRFRRALTQNELDADLRAWLDIHVPGWMEDNTRVAARGMRGRRSFAGQAAAISRFRARHGHLPSPAGSKQRERELGVFLRNHRQAAKGKGTTSWTVGKHLHLDRVIPGWDTNATAASRRPGMEVALYDTSRLATAGI